MTAPGKAVGQAACNLYCEPRFADAAWTRDRHQAHILAHQEFFGGSHLFLPSYKPGPLHGKIAWADFDLLNRLLREAVTNGCEFPRKLPGRDVALVGLFGQAPLDRPT